MTDITTNKCQSIITNRFVGDKLNKLLLSFWSVSFTLYVNAILVLCSFVNKICLNQINAKHATWPWSCTLYLTYFAFHVHVISKSYWQSLVFLWTNIIIEYLKLDMDCTKTWRSFDGAFDCFILKLCFSMGEHVFSITNTAVQLVFTLKNNHRSINFPMICCKGS